MSAQWPKRRSRMRPLRLLPIAMAASVALLAGPPTAPASGTADEAQAGTYVAKTRGGKVKVRVGNSHRATLRYRVRSDCGRLTGRLRLGTLERTFKKREGGGTEAARGRVAGGGAKIKGRLAVSGRADGEECAERRRFVARRKADTGLSAADAGRYEGSTTEGLPFGFDLAVDDGRGKISNLAYAMNADCWNVLDDELATTLVATVTGLEGNVDEAGDFDLGVYSDGAEENDYDDVDYAAYGRVRNGEAWGDVEIGSAVFNELGLLDPAGLLWCEEASFDFITFRAYRAGKRAQP